MFTIKPRTRIQEGASWEDIQDGDCYETGYEICDENGEVIYVPLSKAIKEKKDIKDDKIALSLKFEDQNPWLKADEKYSVGTVVKGKVARMADFGAFIELEPGVDALLHVSQISKEHVDKPSDVLKIGQEVEAKVVDFNKEEHKISLSIKALLNDAQTDEESVEETTAE